MRRGCAWIISRYLGEVKRRAERKPSEWYDNTTLWNIGLFVVVMWVIIAFSVPLDSIGQRLVAFWHGGDQGAPPFSYFSRVRADFCSALEKGPRP